MTEQRHEISENLWITTGVTGNDQESSFMNATLQSLHDVGLEFSVAVHVGCGSEIRTQGDLFNHLREIFLPITEQNEQYPIAVEIQLGPAGDGEDLPEVGSIIEDSPVG